MSARLALPLLLLAACTPPGPVPIAPVEPGPGPDIAPPQASVADVLDLRTTPQLGERYPTAMFDLGAWHGFALPARDEDAGAFMGPLLLGPGWVGPSMARFDLDGPLQLEEAQSLPGRLVQRLRREDGVSVELVLAFASDHTAFVRAKIHNPTAEPRSVTPRFHGSVFTEAEVARTLRADAQTVSVDIGDQGTLALRTSFGTRPATTAGDYSWAAQTTQLEPGSETTAVLAVGWWPTPQEPDPRVFAQALTAPQTLLQANEDRWSALVDRATRDGEVAGDDARVAIKALQTLVSNWRAPRGNLRDHGLFPSYASQGFHGLWSWDSWKHAVAFAPLDGALAQAQLRALFARQNERGMIPDVVYADPAEDNWRDTKPPLSAWAVWSVYGHTQDRAFLAEMAPKLERYHAWWYADRDHDRDGLCEYGSTDGTLVAAAWESGMDNAVRFDGAVMVKNGEGAFSMDRESVDLNAYLFAEKRFLADIADTLGQPERAAAHRQAAATLATQIRETFFDADAGWFRDRRFDGTWAGGEGPEGWTPLLVGVATPAQAEAAHARLVDPAQFATIAPFPTLSAANAEFEPQRGYWRGPVWLDQAHFALDGLRRYGYGDDADRLQEQLFANLAGLRADGPIHETYDPTTGHAQNVPHFSWSSAHILLMLWGEPLMPHATHE